MIGFFGGLWRAASWLFRSRWVRPVLGLVIALWVFDGAVTTATDAAWFSSLGRSALWREQWAWALGVGGAFALLCALVSVSVMRAVARPVARTVGEPPLPRALQGWQPLRARATRWGWAILAAATLILARDVGAQWSDFALASGRSESLAESWMLRAPAVATLLWAMWKFALVLGLVALGAGVLRALPFLAARPALSPRRWIGALLLVGAALCVLRALGFGLEAARHAHEDGLGAARAALVLLNGAGATGCLLVLTGLRRPRARLLLGVAATLVLPSLLGTLSSPLLRGSGQAPLAAPDFVLGGAPDFAPPDEEALLRAARSHLSRDKGRLIEWRGAGISEARAGRALRADLVGAPVVSDAWVGHGLADREGNEVWLSLDLPAQNPSREGQPVGPLFYGLDARPLLSDAQPGGAREAGVPIGSWMWKLAWSWRLRDPLLFFDGARAKRLLVVRGAREIGQKLAPFWTWDEPAPRRDLQTGSAYFECVAYSSSAHFPRRAAFESGLFAGQNAVFPVAVLRLDARSGAVEVVPYCASNAPPSGAAPASNPFSARWQAALPALFGASTVGERARQHPSGLRAAPSDVPTPALQLALSGGAPLVWTHAQTGWQKRALPPQLCAPVEEKIAQFARAAPLASRTGSTRTGSTPVLWREAKTLFLAQSFFDLPTASRAEEGAIASNANPLRDIAGVAVGPLGQPVVRWNSSLAGARGALRAAPQTPPQTAPPPQSAQLRPTTQAPQIAPPQAPAPAPLVQPVARSPRELEQAALEAHRAEGDALKAGHYAKWQQQHERTRRLLEELARRKIE